jgi:hypothetical protein
MRATLSILFVVVTLALVEGLSGAQQPERIARIGWVAFNGSRPPRDFMTGLRERATLTDSLSSLNTARRRTATNDSLKSLLNRFASSLK